MYRLGKYSPSKVDQSGERLVLANCKKKTRPASLWSFFNHLLLFVGQYRDGRQSAIVLEKSKYISEVSVSQNRPTKSVLRPTAKMGEHVGRRSPGLSAAGRRSPTDATRHHWSWVSKRPAIASDVSKTFPRQAFFLQFDHRGLGLGTLAHLADDVFDFQGALLVARLLVREVRRYVCTYF